MVRDRLIPMDSYSIDCKGAFQFDLLSHTGFSVNGVQSVLYLNVESCLMIN